MIVKKYKKDSDVSYTLGMTLTIELLKTKPEVLLKVYIHPELEETIAVKELLSSCKQRKIPIETNAKVFHILSEKENCFVIGEFKKYASTLSNKENHIVLVHPSNAGNLGTILRSATGFEVQNIALISPAVDIFDPKTIRASMGAIFHMNFCYFDDFESYQNQYKHYHLYPFMLQAQLTLKEITFKKPFSLIFGNEATGLPISFLEKGTSVLIPHSHHIDSLNLPIAVSIALYEASNKK